MREVKNIKREPRVVNLVGHTNAIYIPPRGKVALTETEFNSVEIKALIREGYLRETGGSN